MSYFNAEYERASTSVESKIRFSAQGLWNRYTPAGDVLPTVPVLLLF